MGIFRRSSAVPAPAPDPAAALADCLRAIAAREAPEVALQPALQAILEATGAQAGAICLFDVRYGLLRLAAEVGISDEGCRALRALRARPPAARGTARRGGADDRDRAPPAGGRAGPGARALRLVSRARARRRGGGGAPRAGAPRERAASDRPGRAARGGRGR